MRRVAAFLAFLVLLAVSPARADDPAPSMNRAEWRGDLDFLYTQMQAIHPALHHRTDKPTMDAAVAGLRRDIPQMSWPQYVMGLYRLLALVGDGHTTFFPQPDAGPGFDTRYPITPADVTPDQRDLWFGRIGRALERGEPLLSGRGAALRAMRLGMFGL